MNENLDLSDEKFVSMIEKIREMFLEFGIKNLNMDEISRKLGISKKTLYRYVDNKESLIRKIFEYEIIQWSVFTGELAKKPLNAIEKLFEVSLRIHSEIKNLNPMLIFEMKKYYESLYNDYLMQKRQFIESKMRMNLAQGISEGFYRKDLNTELIATFYANYLVEMHNHSMSKVSNISLDQVFEVMFDSYIRGISTPEGVAFYEEGKKELSNYLMKNNNQ